MPSQALREAARDAAKQTSISSSTPTSVDLNGDPSRPSGAVVKQKPAWKMIRDLLGGTPTVRKARDLYLPIAPAETGPEYEARLLRTEVYNGFERALHGMVGMVYRRDPVLGEDMPDVLAEHWENIDNAGSHGAVFTRGLFHEGLALGHAGILVDAPNLQGRKLRLDQERALGIRPYWVPVPADKIVSFRTENIGGRIELTQLVIEENTLEPVGEFGEVEVTRYRQIRLMDGMVFWDLWEKGATWTAVEGGVMAKQTSIPFSPLYTGDRLDTLFTKPPLLELAYSNFAHYQVLADHRTALHIHSVPLLVFKGRPAKAQQTDQIVGPNIGIDVSEKGDVKYVEHSGHAIGETRNELKDLQQRMARSSLAMLERDTRQAETAEAKRIDKGEQDSALASAARAMQDCMELAFVFHGRYLGVEPGSVEINTEFEELTFEPEMINALSQLRAKGDIDHETLWSMLETGNILPDDFDREAVKIRLALEGLDEPPPRKPEEEE